MPALVYRSLFEDYRRHVDAPAASWREVNETVNRIGGWRVYTRQAAAELAAERQRAASAAAAGASAPSNGSGPAPGARVGR